MDALDRFATKVNVTDACHLWTGAINSKGYGTLKIRNTAGKWVSGLAHRFAYEQAFGHIPAGMVVDHECRIRSCVNPAHLRAATNKQNLENRESSSMRGVTWNKKHKAWQAKVKHNGVTHHAGQFATAGEASAAARALRMDLFTHNSADRLSA